MYDLSSFPKDSEFWQLIAFCAGTGGSMLIIGSAAGVAFMGMEKVDFFWYLRKVHVSSTRCQLSSQYYCFFIQIVTYFGGGAGKWFCLCGICSRYCGLLGNA